MISTTTFTSKNVLNKILDDTLPKLTCMVAIPVWFMLLNILLVFWYDIHQLIIQLPFGAAVLFMSVILPVDYILYMLMERFLEDMDYKFK